MSYYDILGANKGSTEKDIKKAYRKSSSKWHPDKWARGTAEEQKKAESEFKSLNEAYQVLSDPNEKARYDRLGHDRYVQSQKGGGQSQGGHHSGFGGFGGFDFNDFFNQRQQPRGPVMTKGERIVLGLGISLEEGFSGVEKTIKFKRKKKCSSCDGTGAQDKKMHTCGTCNGQGQVRQQNGFMSVVTTCPYCHGSGKMPVKACPDCSGGFRDETVEHKFNVNKGAYNGMTLKFAGYGHDSKDTGPAGDLIIQIRLDEHKDLKLGNNHSLEYIVRVSLEQAMLGGKIEIPTLDKETTNLEIKAGTQNGEMFKWSNKGYIVNGNRTPLYMTIHVEIPTSLNRTQRKAFNKFVETMKGE